MFAPSASPYLAFGICAISAFALVWGITGASFAPYVVAFLVVVSGLWLFFALFFRDPERRPGVGIVSAADGRIQSIEQVGDRIRLSVFMNVTDVHVNRVPLDARFDGIGEAGRGHCPAYSAGAHANVQRSYRLSTAIGPVEIVQITGILARRLVSMVKVGESRLKGERFGMIVLGSRVDLWLPADRVRILAQVGTRVRAGETPVAEGL